MMRTSSYALTAALLITRAAQACEVTITGECNYANFESGMEESSCTVTLEELFGDEDPATKVAELCQFDAPTQFVEIQGTYQLDRRYFAGGGPLVDGAKWSLATAQLQRFETNLAKKTVISFPEYVARMKYNENNDLGDNGYPANMNLETGCELNTVMCCFTDGDFDATTDVCHHDLANSPESNHIKEGWSVFPGSEGPTHCVGFTWADDDTELLGNMMYDVSFRNSLLKGYTKGVPGAPMCGCIEHMPVVEQAACRTAKKNGQITYTFEIEEIGDQYVLSASNSADIIYDDCADDLKAQAEANGKDLSAHLVGPGGCVGEVDDYLNEVQFTRAGVSNRYLFPDDAQWSDLVVGEGAYFLPPNIDRDIADAEFRALINAGCKEPDGTTRACIVRRVCGSCSSVAHRDIYYQRKTDLPPPGTNTTAGEANFLDVFMNQWRSNPNNVNEVDFALYSSYQDAVDGANAWTHCNYNHHGVGFPRDCGPNSYVGNQWNSYDFHHGGSANHHGFYVEKP